MSKSIRVRTTPNGDDKYIKVELKQDFDLLEILSLKLKQEDVYQNFCSNYGVVAGRISVNNGFGLPNAKVSIFIPITAEDSQDEIIRTLYPYESPQPQDKNEQGIRYNLLPNQQQNFDHTPVGTFPTKLEILDNATTLGIHEKYYKYTTTTNEAGDFILFGIPVGEQLLHYDIDWSDVGFLSLRPYDLIERGFNKNLFLSPFKFSSSPNLDNLPQLVGQNTNITVEPFWCDDLSTGRVVGITRKDIAITTMDLTPSATFFGSVFSDDEKDSINKNCKPRRKTGRLGEVITSSGKLEAIRRTYEGSIEKYDIPEDALDENGNYALQLPMNIRKVVTDEFGNLIPSPDGVSGVATEGDYRFRISIDRTDNDNRKRQRGKFLVPNMTSNYNFGEYPAGTAPFKINEQLSTATALSPEYSGDTSNQYNYLEDFFSFRWKKVYTTRQFIGRYSKQKNDGKRKFTGIKDIEKAEGVNKFPSNRIDGGVHPLYSILCIIFNILGMIYAIINWIIVILNSIITMLCQLKIPVGACVQVDNCADVADSQCAQLEDDCGRPRCCEAGVENVIRLCLFGTFGFCKCISVQFKWKCILAPLFCKKCQSLCPLGTPHSCCACHDFGCEANDCNDASECGEEDFTCCTDCCIKIPLIELTCAENASFQNITPFVIGTPFARKVCNAQLIKGLCKDCAGGGTPYISAWVGCKLEGIAAFLGMLKFDFYDDWVNGSLYFPLIKRKYKVKKRGKKAGQIKYDKFCDFDCAPQFQTQSKTCYKVSIKNNSTLSETVRIFRKSCCGNSNFGNTNIQWCDITFAPGETVTTNSTLSSGQSGDLGDKKTYECSQDNSNKLIKKARNYAYENLRVNGTGSDGNGCTVNFEPCYKSNNSGPDCPSQYDQLINNPSLNIDKVEYQEQQEHDKPYYISVADPITGIKSQKNVGGHGHHKNKCNTVYRGERLEYWQDAGSCSNSEYDPDAVEVGTGIPDSDSITPEDDDPTLIQTGSCEDAPNQCEIGTCNWGACRCKKSKQDAGSNDKKPCCNCNPRSNETNISHGIIKFKDDVIYYASVITAEDKPNEIQIEYKSNLLFPTNICEVGSSVFCDIDEVPFIMDQLPPTTFAISEESEKFKEAGQSGQAGTETDPIQLESSEKNSANINLSAYVTFGCFGVKCLNTQASVTQSQIGVDTIDTNDLDMQIGTCQMYFDHDEEIREYFCRRFSGYKNQNLDVHYQKPGSTQYDNVYNTYPEILPQGVGTWFQIDSDAPQEGTVNDGEPIIPGDRCGIQYDNYNYTNLTEGQPVPSQIGDIDYFYGVAPGYTQGANALNPVFPTYTGSINYGTDAAYEQTTSPSINIDEYESERGVNFGTSQTPYYFYFGIIPGKTALHKVVGKYFADKIDKTTLGKLSAERRNNQSNYKNIVKNPLTLYKSCLGESVNTTS